MGFRCGVAIGGTTFCAGRCGAAEHGESRCCRDFCHPAGWLSTFGFNQNGGVSGPGQLFVFNPEGQLLRQVSIAGSSPHLLGLAFHPQTGALLVIDFGHAQVLTVNPVSGGSSVFMTVTGNAGLNALAFDQAGNVYVSDSFQGIVWKTGSGRPGRAAAPEQRG